MQKIKSYLLNTLENKIEVYETVYIPTTFTKQGKECFYSNCTLFIYKGSLSTYYRQFNRCHSQVEKVTNGKSLSNYYGGRSIGRYFKILNRRQVIEIAKAIKP